MIGLFLLCLAMCALAVGISLLWLPAWAAILLGIGVGFAVYCVARLVK